MKISLIPLLLPLLLPALFSGVSPATAALAERIPDARLSFLPFDARVGVLPATPVSAVLHSALEYERLVGRPAPAEIDFSREWVAFYSAGVQHTTAAVASIAAIGLIEDGQGLRIATRLSMPAVSAGSGSGRMVPYTMAKFRRPPSQPRKVEWVHLLGIYLAAP
jgi:hypothetical protein